MRLAKVLYIWFWLISGALVLSNCSCSDKGNNPKPHTPDYHVLISYASHDTNFNELYILEVSTAHDSIIDSIYINENQDVCFSKDGGYLYHTKWAHDPAQGATWVTDFSTGDTSKYISGMGGDFCQLSDDARYLLITSMDALYVFNLPDMTLAYDTSQYDFFLYFEMMQATLLPDTSILLIGGATDSIYEVNFSTDPATRMAWPVTDTAGNPSAIIYAIRPFPSGDSIIVHDMGKIHIIRTSDFKTVRTYQVPADYCQYSQLRYTNDLKYLFYNKNGNPYPSNQGGTIYRLNLSTGTVEKYINGDDYDLGYGGALLNYYDLTPDGREIIFPAAGKLNIKNIYSGLEQGIEIDWFVARGRLAVNPIDFSE